MSVTELLKIPQEKGEMKENVYDLIKNRQAKIAVIGLGYVGMPLAVEFAKVADVVGFDISKDKIEQYVNGVDVTKEVGDEAIQQTSALLTWEEEFLKSSKFHIVAVPTPINPDKTPNLKPVIGASEIVGRNLTEGSIVVFESTVYPGVTEDICIPILEKESGLKCGIDFKVGYSPERINPGDKKNQLKNIVKIVSGIDDEALDDIAKVYEMIILAGVHRAESIKVAEAAKVIENSQRDINIAFMNELAIVFDKMGIDTNEVIKAMNTKWNALGFYPGLVGGHCIGVDPYYFIYKAEELGYHSQIIASGRKINDDMGRFVAEAVIKQIIKADKKVRGAKVALFGITFKENCPDVRNSKVIDIINHLREYEIEVIITDPVADINETQNEYGLTLTSMKNVQNVDAIIMAVGHNEFREIDLDALSKMYVKGSKILIDVKSIKDKKEAINKGYDYWSL
ncbi:nucleotide sugar dehydrogenase [Bacillus cereus]|uniref:nucleotide sugar dehydrogenase n=1 Tax=Bacillus cereus TaxID=1396 RepID=UPI0023EE8F58|nr:nucleotide sugar dehydrogenase [Bacillus cereus]